MKDFYYILGTDINCTSNEIREAYRKLSKKFHPDLNQNDRYFENRFKEIREAYETLIDPVRRGQYDAELKKLQTYPPEKSLKKSQYGFKTKHIDIAFTITLVIITLIFGDYVIKSIRGSKAATINKTSHAGISSSYKIIHHKNRHKFKTTPKTIITGSKLNSKIANYNPFVKIVTDTLHVSAVKPTLAGKLALADRSASVAKPTTTMQLTPPVNIKTDHKTGVESDADNILYTATIRSNATGIVYLRKTDNYSSNVVMTIPTNSQVLVLAAGKAFYKIRFNNKMGYVPKWTVQARQQED